MLRRAVVATAVAVIASACASPSTASPWETPPSRPTVVARWSADDGSVTAMNVVVPPRTDVERLRAIAVSFRRDVPVGRLIVTFFAPSAGPERFVIGHMPAGDEALIDGTAGASWLARFDVP